MASADFLQFVVTAASELNLPPSARPPLVLARSFSPCNCLIYWQRFRTATGREIVLHPCPRCLPDGVPIRQFGDLPAPSFRFHLTMDTLGVRLYPSRCRADSGLSPVGTCARRAHQKKSSVSFVWHGGFTFSANSLEISDEVAEQLEADE